MEMLKKIIVYRFLLIVFTMPIWGCLLVDYILYIFNM